MCLPSWRARFFSKTTLLMRTLLMFILRNHFVILFVIIEGLSIALVVKYNDYQHSCFINSSASIAGYTYEVSSGINAYLNLKKKNSELNAELSKLRNTQLISYKLDTMSAKVVKDPAYTQQYEFLPCEVINNSVNSSNNHLTLNIGSKQGVERGMAVISPLGAVGIVEDVSTNFASAISILNQNLKVSAMLANSGYFGSVGWEGGNYQIVDFEDLPGHIKIKKGEPVITSGYSTVFPKGVMIGHIDSVLTTSTNGFAAAKVRLSVDFKNISEVQVVRNLLKKEQLELENRSENE